MQVNELFKQSNTILLDGGMGTMLQASGLKLGAKPEELNITNPELIESIHAKYAAAGSRIVNANTFGASAHKLAGSAYTLEQVITAGIENCKRACAPYGALTALDVGPLGELLEPSGTLVFEDAVSEYARIVRAGAAAGASNLPSSLASMSERNASFVFAAIRASLNSGSMIIVASFERIARCSSFAASGAAMRKKRRAGLPSIEAKSMPPGTVIAARPAARTPALLACGVAMPSPRPVVPEASRARTSFTYWALSERLPPFSMRSASSWMAASLSFGWAPSRMLSCLSRSVMRMYDTPFYEMILIH